MADNLTTQTTVATVPSGSVIATDDVGGVHYQRVKLVDGTDGSATAAEVTSEGNLQAITPSRTASGTIDAADEAVTISTDGLATVAWAITTSNLAGTVVVEVSANGSDWVGWQAWESVGSTVVGSFVNPSADLFLITQVAPFISARLRISAYTSGSATVTAIGSVSNAPYSDTGSAVYPAFPGGGTAAGALRVVEATDSPITASLGVLDDWDESDRAKVNPIVGQAGVQGGAGASSATTQRVAIATDANAVSVTGVSTLTEQQTQTTALQLIDDLVIAEDALPANGDKGIQMLAVRRDTAASSTPTDGDYANLSLDNVGRLRTNASDTTQPVSLTSTTITGTVAVTQSGTWDEVGINDSGNSITVDQATGTNLHTVLDSGTLTTLSTLTTVTNPVTVAGGAAHASPVSGNPNLVAGRASAAIPTDVGADGDAASLWTNRNGAAVVLQAPHIGLNGDPWSLVHEGAQYTAAQTSTVFVAGGASEKIVVTQMQIQAFSTTAGTVVVYFGTGAFARGTNRTIFDGEFKPSTTLAPGAILTGPFIAGANGDDILVTTVGDIDITISCWYYVVT